MIAQRYATAIYEIAKENNKQDEIREILISGTDKARIIAKETLKRVKKAMMLDY